MESMPCPCEPLTREWVEWLRDALSDNRVDDSVNITVEHCATSADEPDFWWHVRVADGKAEAALGPAADTAPNRVMFTSDRSTALAIALGEESVQRAFLNGRLRLSGDVHLLLAASSVLNALEISRLSVGFSRSASQHHIEHGRFPLERGILTFWRADQSGGVESGVQPGVSGSVLPHRYESEGVISDISVGTTKLSRCYEGDGLGSSQQGLGRLA